MIAISTGGAEVWWAGASAAFAAVVAALAVGLRRTVNWVFVKAKQGYKEWFAEAIDEHVQPQFDAIKANTAERATEIKAETDANITRMMSALQQHTAEEGSAIRQVVREELAPLSLQLAEVSETVTVHMERDDNRFDEAARALEAGQKVLVAELQKRSSP